MISDPSQEAPQQIEADVQDQDTHGQGPPLFLRVLPLFLAIIAVGAAVKILQESSVDVSSSPISRTVGSPYNFTAGDSAPDFTLQALDGRMVSLSDYRGKTVLLNFWATWCPPCRSEMPDMEELYLELRDQNFVVVAVNVQESDAPIEGFADQFDLTFPILMDVTGEVSQQYYVQSLPTSYFIDEAGRIGTFTIGPMNRTGMLRKLEWMKE